MEITIRDLFIIFIISIMMTLVIIYFDTSEKSMSLDVLFNEKINKDIPSDAIYGGYEIDVYNNKSIYFYSYQNRVHTIHIYHPINKLTKKVEWNKAINVKYF